MINLALGLPFLYLEEKKKVKNGVKSGEEFFCIIIIIIGIHAVIIYFTLCLQWFL